MKKRFRTGKEILEDVKRSKRIAKLKKDKNIVLSHDEEIKNTVFLGKTVRLKQDDLTKRAVNKELSKEFIDWLHNNIEKEFVVEKENVNGIPNTYFLVGVDKWVFSALDFEIIK